MAQSGPELYLETTGPEDGEPLLLLHGWGSSVALMRPLAEALSDEFRVYNLEMPGHGNTPPPPEPWGVPEHAELVARFVQEKIGGPATFVGHSNGGRISLYMASDDRYKHLVRRLVLISPSGIPRPRSWKYYLRSNVAKALKAPFEVMPEPVREFGLDWLRHSLVWKLLGSSDYAALEGVMRGTFVKTVNCYVQDQIHKIEVPTLLFWGDRDDAVTRAQMDVLESRIPDSGLVVLKDAGHYGYLDDLNTVAAATKYFLNPQPLETADAV